MKKEIKKGSIRVNGVIAKSSDIHIDPNVDKITYLGQPIRFEEYVYYIINKPKGCVSAVTDNIHRTVVDLVKEAYPEEGHDIFPVGRLDVDTEGLLLITNDGKLSHELLSPSKHVAKTYYVEFDIHDAEGLEDSDLEKRIFALEQGLDIGDDKPTKPAKLEDVKIHISHTGEYTGQARLTIVEGRFHQVKRMFQAINCQVTYLKRISFGKLQLDETLHLGKINKIKLEDII